MRFSTLQPFGFVLAVACACNGKTDPSAEESPLVGRYVTRGTNLVTSTHDPSGAPAGFYAPHQDTQTLVVTELGASSFEIQELEGGESFSAELKDNVLEAQNVDVSIDPNGSAYALGRRTRTLRSFRWEIASGSFRSSDSYVTDVPGGGQGLGFIDERIDGVSDATQHWLHYQAASNFPWDFPHGAACVLGGGDTAEGNLGLSYGASQQELEIYLQGVGCSLTATSSDGNIFSASGASCALDPVMSAFALGIADWTFESFAIDLLQKHVSFLARATRRRDDDQVVDLCLELDSDLTGDFPL
ncbi:MAG TPA: hypothetical protein VGJ91_23035 [Polyangiaceae bacterium]